MIMFSGSNAIGSSSSSFLQTQGPFSTAYPTSSYAKHEEASSSQYSYEKALYVAANQYFLNKKAEAARGTRGGASNRGIRGGRGRGSGRGGGSSYVSPMHL